MFSTCWSPQLFFLTLRPEPAPPRQPLRLFRLLKRYALALFDCENRHYPQTEQLWSWRDALAKRIEQLVRENLVRRGEGFQSLLFHATLDEMIASVREGLADQIDQLRKARASEGSKGVEEPAKVACESAPSDQKGEMAPTTEDAAMPAPGISAPTVADPAGFMDGSQEGRDAEQPDVAANTPKGESSLPGDDSPDNSPDFASEAGRNRAITAYTKSWQCSEAALARTARIDPADLSKWKRGGLSVESDKKTRIEKALRCNDTPTGLAERRTNY